MDWEIEFKFLKNNLLLPLSSGGKNVINPFILFGNLLIIDPLLQAWLLWEEEKAMDLMDECFKDPCIETQVQRCIQVGLLCVQKFPNDRPTMSSVVFMLQNGGTTLPQPKEPSFFTERSSTDKDLTSRSGECHSENGLTLTTPPSSR